MRVQQEFSRFASEYGSYNIIQRQVAQKLVAAISDAPKHILDIGCGSGAVFNAINWECEHFAAVDFSESMLQLHPKAKNVTCRWVDFNEPDALVQIEGSFDRVVSASALQWADDLDDVFAQIQSLNAPVSLALFTCNTFKSIYESAALEPILRCPDEIIRVAENYFDAEYELVRYALTFENSREMFRYIKKSGVSAGRRVLDYKQTKRLMAEYPLDYLEFEVLFIQN